MRINHSSSYQINLSITLYLIYKVMCKITMIINNEEYKKRTKH